MLSASRVGRTTASLAFACRRSHGLLSFSTTAPACRTKLRPPPARTAAKGGSKIYPNAKKTYEVFSKVAIARVDQFAELSGSWMENKEQYRSFGIETSIDFDREIKLFKKEVEAACDLASTQGKISRADNPLFHSLRNAFVMGELSALAEEIKYSLHNFLARNRFTKSIEATHKKIADFRYPYEWFPATRAMQRTIHLHVGPTNSGKTYQALKALENAKSGLYAGPLRLLAHEIYSRFLAKGKPCALITGEQQIIPENTNEFFRSCTVEMTPLNHEMDVAVIDEIQMIGDDDRGWAWTQAVLGVRAKEVHLCGEERAVELIQALCQYTGDECIVHRYERLSPLTPMEKSLRGGFRNLEKGDAVVAFSRLGIHSLKRTIEKETGRRCAIVYGSLPPETRAQQAALFNDPDNDYDFLAASDAIGMGLNLEIRRVIFESTHKRNKYNYRSLSISEIKQIGGRAGRFRTAAQAVKAGADEDSTPPTKSSKGQMGYVTALDDADLALIHDAFSDEAPSIQSAGIQVPPSVLERFSTYFPQNTPLSYMLLRLRDMAKISPRFHMCQIGEMVEVADHIQEFPMSIYDRAVFLSAPVALRDRGGPETLRAFARCVSQMDGGHLLDIPEVELELLDTTKDEYHLGAAEYLRRLEALHKAITLYLWLSYRYSGVFRSQNVAFHVKTLVEDRIDAQLGALAETAELRSARISAIRERAKKQERTKKLILGTKDSVPEIRQEGPGQWNEEGHEEPLYEDPAEVSDARRASSQQ